MEKLIELFKDYVDNNGIDTKNIEKEYGIIDYGQGLQYGTREYLDETIVSKKFGFIQWLVDNDKIRKDIYRPIPFKIKIEYEDSVRYIEKLEDRILMELSIQDNPIEFLISILK